MDYFGATSAKLVELLGDNPLSVASERHPPESNSKFYKLSCRVECGDNCEGREKPGLWRQSPERRKPLEARENDADDGEEKRSMELVPQQLLHGFVHRLPREA